MLVIRDEQIRIFHHQPRLNFETEMANYLKRYFPFEAAESDLTRWVRGGLHKALQYGFTTYQESALFLALLAILGAGFDEDPQIPWAAEIITGPQPSKDRISQVYDKGVEFLGATVGPKCSWFVRAKLRVRKQDMAVLDRGVTRNALSAKVQETLTQIYPEKARVVGEKAMKQLATSAVERAAQHGAQAPQSALIHATHMYFLGSEFDQDPCYPWAGKTLADKKTGSPDERYARMHQLSLEYMNRAFEFKG